MIFALGYQSVMDLATDSFAVGAGSGAGLVAKTATEVRTLLSVYTTAQVDANISAAVTGLWDLKTAIDCSANPNYPAASKSDVYPVTVAGKIGGASGKSVDVGDLIAAMADNAGGTEAAVGTSWVVFEHNLVGALLSSNNLLDLQNDSTARVNLGVEIGINVQAWNANLDVISSLTATTDSFMQSKAGAWASRTVTQVKADLGLVEGVFNSPKLILNSAW